MAGPYPNLGFDPCPGDLRGYQALADYAGRSATTLVTAVQTLASANAQDWRGHAADAFRTHVHQEVMPLARKASDSVAAAAAALRTWAVTLAGLQDEARALDRQAAPYHDDLNVALRSAGLPAGSTPPYPATVKPAQRARLDQANSALSAILAKANDLHTRYQAAVQQADSQLDDAGNMAPHPPGLFASLWHDAGAGWDDAVRFIGHVVHDKRVLEFISGVANIVATVAGLLALFPPLSLVFAPIALGAAAAAMGADALLAMFDGGSWGAVILDAGAVVADAGWIRAASRLSGIYRASGSASVMTEAPTWAGVVSKVPLVTRIPKVGAAIEDAEKTVEVAPGMFRMIGASLRAMGGDSRAADAMSAVKDFGAYGKWRAVDIVAGQVSWSFSAAGIEAIPGNIRTWVNGVAMGKTPWRESADAATGLG